MKRKVNKVGTGTLTISLPKKWVDEHNVKQGDEIEVVEEGNGILLSLNSKNRKRLKKVKLEEYSFSLTRTTIASAYKAGYGEIILTFKEKTPIQDINNIVNSFTGLEIISQNDKEITIRSFLFVDQSQIDNLIVKMFQVVKVLFANILNEWNKISYDYVYSTVKGNIIKTRDHCLRMIHSTKYKEDLSYDYYDFVTTLEKFSGELLYFSDYIINEKEKKSSIIKEISIVFEEIYFAYLKKDFKVTNAVYNKLKILEKQFLGANLDKLIAKENAGIITHYYHMVWILRQLASRLVSLSC